MIRRLIQLILDQSAARKLEKDVNRSMRKVARDSESTMSKAFKRIGALIIAAFSVRAVVRFTKEMFRLGASAAETGSKFETVFGAERARELDGFLGKFEQMAGLTRTAGREMLANFGAIFQGAGVAADASAKLSEQALRLAADFQSFHDIPIAETFAAIRSGAVGETEPLKRLGVQYRALEVDKRALHNTGKDLAKELTEEERLVARMQIIFEKAGVVVGDLARTKTSTANRARILGGRFDRMRETVAVGLLPALERLIPIFEQLANKAETFANKTAGGVTALLDLAGIANQEASIGIASITAQLHGMNEAQRQAFLTDRLIETAAEYETLRDKIVEAKEALADINPMSSKAAGAAANRARAELHELERELEAASEIMNAISGMMGTGPALGPIDPPDVGDGGESEEEREKRLKAERDFQLAMWDDEEKARKANLEYEREQEEERRQLLEASWESEAAARRTVEELKRQEFEKTWETAARAAEGMTSAFQTFFEASASGWRDQGGVWQAAVGAAREASASIVGALVAGRAEEQMAQGTAALASGIWPPNPAAIASALKHFAAAALFRAIPGAIRGGGSSGGGGGGVSVPRGPIGVSTPATQQIVPPAVNIWMDPFDPADARHQRATLGAVQNAQERFGSNVKVNVRPRTGGGSSTVGGF